MKLLSKLPDDSCGQKSQHSIYQRLAASRLSGLSVREQLSGITDPSVVALALQKKAILITEDKDFGELVFAHKIAKLTIVFLRYQKQEVELMRQLLGRVIREYSEKEGNFFVTIARGKIRVTEL